MRSAVAIIGLVLAGCGGGSSDAAADGEDDAPPPRAEQTTGGTAGAWHVGTPPVGKSGGGGSGDPAACEVAPADAAAVSAFIDTLPYAPPDDAARAEVVSAIVKTCAFFAPAGAPGYTKRHCWAHLASSIHTESAYDAHALVTDAYAKRAIGRAAANDPTVGLLQIRFSSTVHDYASYGPTDALACIGCTLPSSLAAHLDESGDSTFWAIDGPTANMAFMKTRSCNVALGAWYYYVNATGNGDATRTTYIADYCGGGGAAANLVTGLRSHLDGPSVGRGVIPDMSGLSLLASTDPGAYDYVSTTKQWFDGMIGPATGMHPFFVRLPPSRAQYCR